LDRLNFNNMEKYKGKINEFVDWVTGDNSFTG
jgi:hypothetical protein